MDPYLEQEGIWHQIHTGLIVGIQYFLAPLLQPNYKIIIEQLTYVSLSPTNGGLSLMPITAGQPDNLIISPKTYVPATSLSPTRTATLKPISTTLPTAEAKVHRYLEIRDQANEVITVIEIISPINKRGQGREQYLHKRQNILATLTHLIEIDLLRRGKPLPVGAPAANDYRIIVSRSPQRPAADLYLFSIREPIPDTPVPLREGDAEPLLKLNSILHQVYEAGYYANLVDYTNAPPPAFSEEDRQWVEQLLQTTPHLPGAKYDERS
jgi:hypothetical protein